jgi:hypothetical protein
MFSQYFQRAPDIHLFQNAYGSTGVDCWMPLHGPAKSGVAHQSAVYWKRNGV